MKIRGDAVCPRAEGRSQQRQEMQQGRSRQPEERMGRGDVLEGAANRL